MAVRVQLDVLCLAVLCVVWTSTGSAFKLTILHTNDVHSRYDQTNKYSGQCSAKDAADDKCFGGFPRLYTKVQELRRMYKKTVLVDAGDQYQGTMWFYKYGGNITAHFMNLIGYDVMVLESPQLADNVISPRFTLPSPHPSPNRTPSPPPAHRRQALGNHEFDHGPAGVQLLLDLVTFPVLSSNVNASHYPAIQSKLAASVVLDIGGERVGFVGYTTVDTKDISNPREITFNDEVAALTSEVERLTSEGVNKIVCVGHAGFVKDLTIARDVPGVDVVVGGHTNTFLYNGEPPSNEDPADSYPVVITRGDGTRALVVQDYAFAKYLGFLQVEFDDAGTVTSWSGNPILLDRSVARDAALSADLAGWQRGLDETVGNVIGNSLVMLMGRKDVCRLQECNLGNMISDAMVMQNLRHSDSVEWNHVAISFVNSGSIRTSIEKGDITLADVMSVQPFRNTVDIVELNGSAILQVMEHSASKWDRMELNGAFLQHSGLHVVYDLSQPKGHRVKDVKVKCADCEIPEFVDLEPSKVYKVVMSSFLATGGDAYSVITDNTIKRHLIGDLDTDVLTEYIKKFSPIISGLEGRIRFVNGSVEEETGSRGGGDGGRVCLSAGTAMLSPCGTLLWMACVAICAVGLLRQ